MKKQIILFIILFSCSALFSAELYTVQEDDNLSGIARRYEISIFDISDWNYIQNLDQIAVGQVFFVEEPVIEDIYQEKVEPLKEQLKQLKQEMKARQKKARTHLLYLLITFTILLFIFIIYHQKNRKKSVPPIENNSSNIETLFDKLEQNILNAFEQKKTIQPDFTAALTEKMDLILLDYQQQVATKNIENQFLLEQWQQCKQDLISFDFLEINKDLETLSQIFINPIKKENQFKRNDCYALSQILAGLEEILYWHHWLVLPIDKKFINTLASLIELSKLIALQQHYYIHQYPIDNNSNPRYYFDNQFKKISYLSNNLDLLELISANILDLLLLLNEIKANDKDKNQMIQSLFKSETPIQYQNSIEIQARRVNRRRIYGFNHLSIFNINSQKSQTKIEVEQY